MRIDLAEWETAHGVELSPEALQLIARTRMFSVRPDVARPGRWSITASQFVGTTRFDDLSVRVRPKIRPHRLIELLVSSIDQIAWDQRDVEWATSEDLVPTIAGAFLAAAERALHAGILQGYFTEEADLYAVRGRIDLSRQLARNPGLPLPIAVSYDEYSTNVIENQLLAGAGRLLLRLPGVPAALLARLRRLEYQLIDVVPTRPSPSPPAVHWTRLNLRYRPAVALARIILRSGSLMFEEDGSTAASGFMVDMNRVFEDVVGHGLRQAFKDSDLTVDLQRWDDLDTSGHVQIRPDITIRRGPRVVAVADAKYKRVSAQGPSPDNVYQALAYAARYHVSECTLIYPERPPYDRVEVNDISVELASLELDQPRRERTAALQELAGRLVSGSQALTSTSSPVQAHPLPPPR
ncbi:McrC family protein [Leifsonia poae]|uniref:McrC family protein n=1 Tax=Leifsonia poae TaxID=110933 RepID=UPI003D69C7EE